MLEVIAPVWLTAVNLEHGWNLVVRISRGMHFLSKSVKEGVRCVTRLSRNLCNYHMLIHKHKLLLKNKERLVEKWRAAYLKQGNEILSLSLRSAIHLNAEPVPSVLAVGARLWVTRSWAVSSFSFRSQGWARLFWLGPPKRSYIKVQ